MLFFAFLAFPGIASKVLEKLFLKVLMKVLFIAYLIQKN